MTQTYLEPKINGKKILTDNFVVVDSLPTTNIKDNIFYKLSTNNRIYQYLGLDEEQNPIWKVLLSNKDVDDETIEVNNNHEIQLKEEGIEFEHINNDIIVKDIGSEDFYYCFYREYEEDEETKTEYVYAQTFIDAATVSVYSIVDKVITLLGEGSIESEVLTYNENTYNRYHLNDNYYINKSDKTLPNTDVALYLFKQIIRNNVEYYKRVSTFANIDGDSRTLYYLDTNYSTFKKGFYGYTNNTFVKLVGGAEADNVTIIENSNDELQANSIIDVETLPVANILTNTIYRKVELTPLRMVKCFVYKNNAWVGISRINITSANYALLTQAQKEDGTLYVVDGVTEGIAHWTYASLTDKPSINNITLLNNLSLADLSLYSRAEINRMLLIQSGRGLFDIITKDYLIDDPRIALLGTTVAKTTHEKFYETCKEEYEAITNQKLYTFHYIDYADMGTPSNISNYGYKDLSMLGNTKCTFSNSAYFQFMNNLNIPQYTTWEFNCKLKYTADVSAEQMLCNFGNSKNSLLFRVANKKLRINLSSNGTSWNIADGTSSTNTLDINKDYYIKLIYNGSNYRVLVSETGEFNGEEVEYIKVEISTPIYNNQADDSKNVWNNLPRNLHSTSPNIEFDMKYYSIKVGDNFVYTNEDWYLVKNSNGHIYYDATTERKRTFRYLEANDRGTASNISNYGYKDIWKAGDMKVNFSNGAYFKFLDNLEIGSNTWEFNIKLKYIADYTGYQMLCCFGNEATKSTTMWLYNRKLGWSISGNGSGWNISNGLTSSLQLTVGTEYYIKYIYNGENYRILVSETGAFEGEEVEYLKVENTNPIYNNLTDISSIVCNQVTNNIYASSPLVEFDMLYYNIKVGDNYVYTNQDVWVDFGRDKAMVDEEYTENGVSWYYGINTTNETVKLPRDDSYGINRHSPDYSKQKVITVDYVAEADGFINAIGNLVNSGGSTNQTRIGIDGTTRNSVAVTTGYQGTLICPISKGQKVTDLRNVGIAYFIPNAKEAPKIVYMVVNDNNE